MLRVDGLEVNQNEITYVLKYYKKHKKDFKQYKDDKIALQGFLSDIVRQYREDYGYTVSIKNRLRFEHAKKNDVNIG